MEQLGIATESTQVGDKYVYECMVKKDYMLGGEQSGHIIFKEHATTGDGLLTALKLLEVMHKTGKGIVELKDGLKIYPQLLINVPVKDKEAAMQADQQGQVRTGRGVTGDQFIDQDQRNSIIERLDPLCVDMESAAVAHVAYANDVPFLAIRAISDTPFNSGLEVYHAHSESAAKQALILFNAMMRKGKPIE